MSMSDRCVVQIAWGDDPYTVSKTWTTVSGDGMEIRATTCRRASEFDAFSAGRATITLYDPDRDYDPTYASSPYVGQFLWGTPIRVRGSVSGTPGDVWVGYITRFTPLPGFDRRTRIDAIDGLGLLAEWELPTQAAAGEGQTVKTRVAATLTAANHPSGARDLENVQTRMQDTIRGRSALAELNQAALCGGGLIYHQPATGDIVLDGRHSIQTRSRQASVQFSFGGAGEIGVLRGSLEVGGVTDLFRNIVKVTPSSEFPLSAESATPTTYTAGSVASTASERAIQRKLPIYENDAQDLATYLTDLYDTAVAAPKSWSSVAHGATKAHDDTALSVRLRDRVNVEWESGAENADVLITGITHRVTPDLWTVTYMAEAAAPYDNLTGAGGWMVVGDATLGKVGTGKVGY